MTILNLPIIQEPDTDKPSVMPLPSGPRSLQFVLRNKNPEREVLGEAVVQLHVSNNGQDYIPYLTPVTVTKDDAVDHLPGVTWVYDNDGKPYGFVIARITSIDDGLFLECHIAN